MKLAPLTPFQKLTKNYDIVNSFSKNAQRDREERKRRREKQEKEAKEKEREKEKEKEVKEMKER